MKANELRIRGRVEPDKNGLGFRFWLECLMGDNVKRVMELNDSPLYVTAESAKEGLAKAAEIVAKTAAEISGADEVEGMDMLTGKKFRMIKGPEIKNEDFIHE